MFVSDIIDEAKLVLSKCDLPTVYRRITDAVKLANTSYKGNDWNIAMMDLCVCDGCVTLPADVGTVLGANHDGFPTLIRDQWFQFHANGPGSNSGFTPWSYTDELGPVVTFKDPSKPVILVAEVEEATDANCATLRVFGWDADGKRIYTRGPDDTLLDGFLVPLIYGFSPPNPEAPAIARIDRIQKSLTKGFIRLLAVNPDDLQSHTLIGYYQPWETVPNYRRVRTPGRSWLRIKYRRKDLEVRASTDWINIENREALLLLLKAVQFRLNNQFDQARAAETEGLRLLSQEAESLRPTSIQPPQIIFADGIPSSEDDNLFNWVGP